MTLYRTTAPEAMLAFFKSLLGTPYSENSPPGSDADGHLWVPGEGKPNHLDCSGATYYVVREVTGIDIDQGDVGNAVGQWNRWQSLRVLGAPAPGDLLYFLGAGPAPVGHTGMCIDASSYISAYDTAEGLCVKPFSINHALWDHYVGAVRIANVLPAPPAPKPPPPKPPAPMKPADVWAKDHGMSQIDRAEANLLRKYGLAWYYWNGNGMTAIKGPAILPRVRFGYTAQLDAHRIPHAGP